MASPHHPQHPRHPFIPDRTGSPLMPSSNTASSSSSSSSGIPFNTSAHNFNAPSPLSFGFGGVKQQQQQQQSNGFGSGVGAFGQQSAASSSKISSPSPLGISSFGFNSASTGTGFQSPHHQQQASWTSPHFQQQQQYTSPNIFGSAFASSSTSRSHQQHQSVISPSPTRTITQHQQRTAHGPLTEALDPSSAPISAHQHGFSGNAGVNAGKRRRSPSEDDSMDRSSPTPTPTLGLTASTPTTTSTGSTITASATPTRSLKRARADPLVVHNQHTSNNHGSSGEVGGADHDDNDGGLRRVVRARRGEASAVRAGGRSADEDVQGEEEESEADLGVLLASLPSTTHLQILLSLLSSHPGLKRSVLDLIPPPELEFAVKVLDEKCAVLLAALPVGAAGVGNSNGAAAGSLSTTTTAPVRRAGHSASFGFGTSSSNNGNTSSSSPSSTSARRGTVSDGYILNRLRIPFTDFSQVVLTYLPYFVGSPSSPTTESLTGTPNLNGTTAAVAGRRQIPAPHPSITFQYLSHLTALLIQRVLPVLPASILYHTSSSSNTTAAATALPHLPILLRALENAWRTWLERVSEHVNVRAGMYAASMAREWIAGIEELRDAAAVLAARGAAEVEQQQEGGQNVGSASRHANNINTHTTTTTTTATSKADYMSSSAAVATTLARSLAQLADAWVEQVGWLIGRSPGVASRLGQEGGMMVDRMDEEL